MHIEIPGPTYRRILIHGYIEPPIMHIGSAIYSYIHIGGPILWDSDMHVAFCLIWHPCGLPNVTKSHTHAHVGDPIYI